MKLKMLVDTVIYDVLRKSGEVIDVSTEIGMELVDSGMALEITANNVVLEIHDGSSSNHTRF